MEGQGDAHWLSHAKDLRIPKHGVHSHGPHRRTRNPDLSEPLV